jgi:hypothetical protein
MEKKGGEKEGERYENHHETHICSFCPAVAR